MTSHETSAQHENSASDGATLLAHWTIRDIALEFGVTTRTLRFYEDKGLISPLRKNGNRIFTQRDRELLSEILRGKRLGFSLEAISQYIKLTQGEVLDEIELHKLQKNYKRQVESLIKQREDIEIVIARLQYMTKNIDARLQGEPEDNTLPPPNEHPQIPPHSNT